MLFGQFFIFVKWPHHLCFLARMGYDLSTLSPSAINDFAESAFYILKLPGVIHKSPPKETSQTRQVNSTMLLLKGQ
jgi:hypothetical protein